MTNLQAKKAELEMAIAKLQEELAQVEAQIVAEENTVVTVETSTLEVLVTKIEADAEKFGVQIENIEVNVSGEEELELMARIGQFIQNSITVSGVNGMLEVNEDGSAELFNLQGDFIKTYKKVGSAVKALGKIVS